MRRREAHSEFPSVMKHVKYETLLLVCFLLLHHPPGGTLTSTMWTMPR